MGIAKNTRGGRPKLYENRAEVWGVLSETERAELRALVDELGSSTSRTVSALVVDALARIDRSTLPSGRRLSKPGKQMVSGYVSGDVAEDLEDLVTERDTTKARTVGALLAWGLKNTDRTLLPRGRKAAAGPDQGELPLAAS